ncbi:MAG: GTPase Era [Syntrophomonadaceae bacterium]|nr:GTPase Era [Bacillota bacterium]
MFRSGFVALIGRPNVGKSTLVNTLVGEKTAIVSDKPQTTRNKLRGVLTTDNYQLILIDTPGIHKPHHRLGEKMVQVALRTCQEVDIVLFLADARAGPGSGDEYVLSALTGLTTPVILAVNKADLATAEQLAALQRHYRTLFPFSATLAVSALTGANSELLLAMLAERLPEGPCYYPADMFTDQPVELLVAELVREKVLALTRDEVPHAVAVEIVALKQRESQDLLDIEANIYVERESQKGILIGKNGALLKEVGTLSRREIEGLLGSRVFLRLWVKVKRDWRNKEGTWRELGLEFE